MILVVAEHLELKFVLLHQGRFMQSARTATDALRVLRGNLPNIQGVVLDYGVPNARLVSGYLRNNAPGLRVVSMQIAQRNSPFRSITAEDRRALQQSGELDRYIWDRSQAIGQ